MLALFLAACATKPGKPVAPTPPVATPVVVAPTPPKPVPPRPPPVARPTRVDGITIFSPRSYLDGRSRVRQALVTEGRDVLASADVGYYVDVMQGRLRQVAGKGASVARSGDRIVVSLPSSLLFEPGQPRIGASLRPVLVAVAKVLVEYSKTVVAVEGHSANIGDEASNRQWTEQRALAVAQFLRGAGVASKRLVVSGLGAARPLAGNVTPAGLERNRRIELWIEPVVSGPRR